MTIQSYNHINIDKGLVIIHSMFVQLLIIFNYLILNVFQVLYNIRLIIMMEINALTT